MTQFKLLDFLGITLFTGVCLYFPTIVKFVALYAKFATDFIVNF